MELVEERLVDILAYTIKYESKEDAKLIKGILRRYLMMWMKSKAENNLGTDSLEQEPCK